MSNRYYQAGRERGIRVRTLFGGIAPRYDLVNDVQSLGLHRVWKRRLVRCLGVRPGEWALDLCCGTGDVAFRLARAGAQVVGLDFSLPMLQVAGLRAARCPAGRRPCGFVAGDGLRLPLADAVVDVVTISYGLRNLPDYARALREMARVTRPGGRLAILDFGKPPWAVWRRLYFAYLGRIVPWYGRLLCGDAEAYGYILESLHHYPGQDDMAGLMAATGWADICVENLLGGVMGLHLGRRSRVDPRDPSGAGAPPLPAGPSSG